LRGGLRENEHGHKRKRKSTKKRHESEGQLTGGERIDRTKKNKQKNIGVDMSFSGRGKKGRKDDASKGNLTS